MIAESDPRPIAEATVADSRSHAIVLRQCGVKEMLVASSKRQAACSVAPLVGASDMVGGETKWPLAQGKRPVQVRANMIADGGDHDENIDDDGDGDDDDNDGDYDDGATEEYEG